jgi:hypothetical protein
LTASDQDMKRKISRTLADYYRAWQKFELIQADLAAHPCVRDIYLNRAACYDELIKHAESCADGAEPDAEQPH